MSNVGEIETNANAGNANSDSDTSQSYEWPGVAVVPFPIVAARIVTGEQLEFEASMHDRCRSQLRDVAHNWVRVSGKVFIGDRVRICKMDHPAYGHIAVIMDYNDHTHQARVSIKKSVLGTKIGIVERQWIEKIHGSRYDGIPMRVEQIEQGAILTEFVHEAKMELDRIQRSSRVHFEGQDCDRRGVKVYIGDIVEVVDRKHVFFEWKMFVD